MSHSSVSNHKNQDTGPISVGSIEIPVIPLIDLVAYPKVSIPLQVARPFSMWAIEAAQEEDGLVFLVSQRRRRKKQQITREDVFDMGTVGKISRTYKVPDGGLSVLVQGLYRATIQDFFEIDDGYVAGVTKNESFSHSGTDIEALRRTVAKQVHDFADRSAGVSTELVSLAKRSTDAGWLADLVAANGPMELDERQDILETLDVYDRLYRVSVILAEELQILDVRGRIQTKIQDGIEKVQRDFYLREQLRAIQKELGIGGAHGEDVDELRELLGTSTMPDHVRDRTGKEIDRLESIPPTSPEIAVVRTYIEWLLELPWSMQINSKISLAKSRKVLDRNHYGLREIKDRVLEYLAVRSLSDSLRSPILCFVGPPGVGKTSLGKSIATAMDREFVRVSLGGVRDEAEIRGHRRTYVGALPGRIIQGMRQAGSTNPVFVLDEIDKIGNDFRGDPSSALLEVLDPEHNSEFSDHYLEVAYDLSQVIFILTANDLGSIPNTLRDRLEIIELSGYTESEKLSIARKHLIPRQLSEHGIKQGRWAMGDEEIRTLIHHYTREAGVRNLERQLARLCRKAARTLAAGTPAGKKIRVSTESFEDLLGPRKYDPDEELCESAVGIVNGLAVTSYGGEILPVEAAWMKGTRSFTRTGNLGDVMAESARAALSVAQNKATSFGLQPNLFDNSRVHLHVPAGAVPKDGPSAGIAMSTALVSAMLGVSVRGDLAMTGEVTLRGKVLPIGGVKEKLLAAHRAGIKEVLLPHENRRDVEDLPKEIHRGLTLIFVETIDQVLAAAIRPDELRRFGAEISPRIN